MRRLGPGRALSIGFIVSLVLALVVGGSLLPASGGPADPQTNRFGRSGIHTADPLASRAEAARARAEAATATAADVASVPGPSVAGSGGCPDGGSNVRANQECTNQSAAGFFGRGQGQNETAVAVNPRNPRNILIGQNDYRRGDSSCGVDWSLDGGRHWGSELVPLSFTAPGFTGARHYWDAAGDPSVAFDSSGEAYLFCLAFNRGTPTSDAGLPASGLFLLRSADGGASWSFPASAVKQSDGSGEDGIGLLDKPYMAVDTSRHSGFRDRIYVAWAEYNVDFSAATISFAWSGDHGATWNLTGAISGSSPTLCPRNFSGAPAGTCDANQFPQPFIAPNGDLYVVFQNQNNAVAPGGDNHAQMLIVKSTDGGASFGAPVKVSDWNDLPDCVTYTGFDAGVACVPTAPLSDRSIFRATNYPSGVAVTNNRIVVTFGSYINRHSNPTRGNCTPAGFAATGLNLYDGVGETNGCNNDIVVSVSTDGGASFTGTTTPVEQLPSISDERATLADQWWQWAALTPRGGVAVAYYDRKYGTDQQTGFMDITMRRGNGSRVRVTDRSLPPLNEFPVAGASTGIFLGDYIGLAVGSDGKAHPAWADTRNPIFTQDPADVRRLVNAGQGSDIYTRSLPG